MYKNSFVHYLTKVLVDIMFYGGILACISVPFAVPWFLRLLDYQEAMIVPYTVIIFTSGLCALCIVWQLKSIFKTLLGGNPFVPQNVNCLRICSVASFVIAILYIIRLILWFTVASFIIVTIFSLLGLFCLTLKDVFKQAIAYKEENDWTV